MTVAEGAVTGAGGVASGVVIIGAGHAGVQLADSLRAEGYAGPLTLVGDEEHLPYQRPPLSKDFMADLTGEALPLRGESFYPGQSVDLVAGRVASIDRADRRVRLAGGSELRYDRLVFATGARNRTLPVPGAELTGIHHLRTLDDALAIQAQLAGASRAVVVGAGFIGLEFAAAARARGIEVTVLEAGSRPLGRALSSAAAEHLTDRHRTDGIQILLETGVSAFTGAGDRADTVVDSSGSAHAADLVVCGVGVRPNTELAAESGLLVEDGIVVDESLRTSDPAIHAIGDCCRFPTRGLGPRRLESVQNATEQAKHLAKVLTSGKDAEFVSVPWFWSQQGKIKIQIVGLLDAADEMIVRGDPETGKFSVCAFADGRLTCVESINSVADHMAARRILERGLVLSPKQIRDPDFDLKAFSKAQPALVD